VNVHIIKLLANSISYTGVHNLFAIAPHYICFYELRPPVSSRFFIFCIFCSASTHWAYSASARRFGRLSTKYPSTAAITYILITSAWQRVVHLCPIPSASSQVCQLRSLMLKMAYICDSDKKISTNVADVTCARTLWYW